MRLLLLSLIALSVTSCAKWGDHNPEKYTPVYMEQVEKLPYEITKRTGDMIITSWDLFEQKDAIYLESRSRVTGENSKKIAGSMDVGGHNFDVLILPGYARLAGIGRDGSRYYQSQFPLEYKYGGWEKKLITGGVVLPRNSNTPAKAYWHPPESPQLVVSVEPNHALDIKADAGPYSELESFEGAGKTITYLGLSGGQLHFVYKEFNDSLIRDAFTQPFSFDYVPEETYRFKSASFIVHSATPGKITFTPLTWF